MGYLLCHSLCFELPVIVGRNLYRNSSPLIQCLWFEFVPKMSRWNPKSFHNLPPCFLLTSRSSMRNHAKGGGFAFCAFLTLIAGFLCEIIKRTLALGIYIVEVLVINCSTSPIFFLISLLWHCQKLCFTSEFCAFVQLYIWPRSTLFD